MDDATFGAKLCRAYDEYAEHHAAGRLGDDAPPPHEIVNQLFQGNRDGRAAQAEDNNNGLGRVEIMRRTAADAYPPAGPNQPKPPVPDPGVPVRAAQDSQHGVYVRGLDHAIRFVPHGGRMLPGDVEVHTPPAVPSTAASQRRMAATIAGYDRLGRR